MRKGCQIMTQTMLLGGEAGDTAGIVLKSSRKIGDSKTENEELQEHSGGQKIFLEILFPAGIILPDAGTPLLILPQSRKGIMLNCRITGSNSGFLRVVAEIRLDGSGSRTGVSVKSPRNKLPWR